jgi:hypothetical protein
MTHAAVARTSLGDPDHPSAQARRQILAAIFANRVPNSQGASFKVAGIELAAC